MGRMQAEQFARHWLEAGMSRPMSAAWKRSGQRRPRPGLERRAR
jgi:hypothetical protein